MFSDAGSPEQELVLKLLGPLVPIAIIVLLLKCVKCSRVPGCILSCIDSQTNSPGQNLGLSSVVIRSTDAPPQELCARVTCDEVEQFYSELHRCTTKGMVVKKLLHKLLVYVTKEIDHRGGCLVLSGTGISMEIPPGAVVLGRKEQVSLVLVWDLSDGPELASTQALISPVVYCGPHGTVFQKPCILVFKHCTRNTAQTKVYTSDTDLLSTKSWSAINTRDKKQIKTQVTRDECQVHVSHFSLFTCILEQDGKECVQKWLQLAIFSSPLTTQQSHFQIRVYFLNNTPCALQWAIYNEAPFQGNLCGPVQLFDFRGNSADTFLVLKYLSEGWENVDECSGQAVPYLQIWHGKCPFRSFCFKKKSPPPSLSLSQPPPGSHGSREARDLQLSGRPRRPEKRAHGETAAPHHRPPPAAIGPRRPGGGSVGKRVRGSGPASGTMWMARFGRVKACRQSVKKVQYKNEISDQDITEIIVTMHTYQHGLEDQYTEILRFHEISTRCATIKMPGKYHCNRFSVHRSGWNRLEDGSPAPIALQAAAQAAPKISGPKSSRFGMSFHDQQSKSQNSRPSSHPLPGLRLSKRIPRELFEQLQILLEPCTITGNDWRKLASQLGLCGTMIRYFSCQGSPAAATLEKFEEQNGTLNDLYNMMVAMERLDCASTVENYLSGSSTSSHEQPVFPYHNKDCVTENKLDMSKVENILIGNSKKLIGDGQYSVKITLAVNGCDNQALEVEEKSE
uniref:UNC5C-like protein n=1 Tax=Pristiophorus japonicus TaxID=55135 RepID=UPI00398E6669